MFLLNPPCGWVWFRSVYDIYQVRNREDQVSREIWENRGALSYNLQTLVFTWTYTLGNGLSCKDSNSNFLNPLYRSNLRLLSQKENYFFLCTGPFCLCILYSTTIALHCLTVTTVPQITKNFQCPNDVWYFKIRLFDHYSLIS